jgi:hypothetical protein
MEDQEIGNVEAQHQGHGPDDQRELERAGIEAKRHLGAEQVDIIIEDEGRDDLGAAEVEEADGQHDKHGQAEEQQQHDHERRHLQPRRALAGILDGLRFDAVGCREGVRRRIYDGHVSRDDQDETNSFQRRVR